MKLREFFERSCVWHLGQQVLDQVLSVLTFDVLVERLSEDLELIFHVLKLLGKFHSLLPLVSTRLLC